MPLQSIQPVSAELEHLFAVASAKEESIWAATKGLGYGG